MATHFGPCTFLEAFGTAISSCHDARFTPGHQIIETASNFELHFTFIDLSECFINAKMCHFSTWPLMTEPTISPQSNILYYFKGFIKLLLISH
jgi:hypothetical protein